MFLHVISPLFRDKCHDAIINLDCIEYLDIEKFKKENEIYWRLVFCSKSARFFEIYSTEKEAKERLVNVLTLLGNYLSAAQTMANDFMPDDRTLEEDNFRQRAIDSMEKMQLATAHGYNS